MVQALRNRQNSAWELIALHLERMERSNQALTTIVTRNDDHAR
jgi:hypothetical protein